MSRVVLVACVMALVLITTPAQEPARAAGGIIRTFAGSGTAGLSGDGGAATSAEFNGPSGLAVDASGSLYVADYINCRVRKISAGTISTFAGVGTGGAANCGEAGDGGPATSAQLGLPGTAELVFDNSGNLYIGDSSPYCHVREVVTATINSQSNLCAVGGTPSGIELHAGSLYISDWTGCRIWKADGLTLTLIAGTGTCGYNGDGISALSAELNHPVGLRFDAAGNLYVADSTNCRVREIRGGMIGTIAGTSVCGYNGDGGPATAAELYHPEDLLFDGSGSLYIADTINCRVRKIVAGIIATVAGNGTCGYSGDGGPASNAEINGPAGLAIDLSGNLYVGDFNNNVVRVVYAPPSSVGGVAEEPEVTRIQSGSPGGVRNPVWVWAGAAALAAVVSIAGAGWLAVRSKR
ncbi:MAG: hypothetical protein KGK07_12435 [Chloroflexota bacterium]|nr:hypothetical protein [Chloroflexota bacterium]